MLLTSYPFLFFFFPISLLVFFLIFEKKKKEKILFLGFISAYFYYLDNGYLISILLFLAIFTKIQIQKQYFSNIFYIFVTLLPLIIFKYSYIFYTFLNLEIPHYIQNNFPIGLSFFTFQTIAYYFDPNRYKNSESTFEIFTFLAFFPQLLAGPIVDIATFRTGLKHTASKKEIYQGVERLSVGLLKKFFIADTLSEITSIYVNSNEIYNFSFLSSFILIFSYTFQIYFDFSGYCDIAIGLGLFFGFKLPENFDSPYLSKSFKEFWQRWHITLSIFFKNHVYIPLGGNRVSTFITYRNLWITFFCTAFWHGSSLTFLFWGFLHGLFLTVEKLMNFNKFISNRFITFVLLSLSWVPFFAINLKDVFNIYSGILNFDIQSDYFLPLIFQNIDLRFIVASVFCILTLKARKIKLNQSPLRSYSLFLLALIVVLSSSVDPFIYFRF